MSIIKISEMTQASELSSADALPVVNAGATKKTLLGGLADWVVGTYPGYIPLGLGGVRRSLQEKLREMASSVKDYGGSGSGSGDDSDAFLAAAENGIYTFVGRPVSSYKFAAPITPKKVAFFLDPAARWEALTDSGKLSILRGGRPNWADGQNIWRFADRVFIGDAAAKLSGEDTANAGTSWFADAGISAHYLARNGKVVVSSTPDYDDVPYMFVAGVRTSDTNQEAIGLGVNVIANRPGSYAWGSIFEMQREISDASVYGIEIGAKNKGNNAVLTPNAQVVGMYGSWYAAGGDERFAGSPTAPATAAMVVLAGESSAFNTWNSGIVFMRNSLTSGEAIAMSSEGIGGAHAIRWYNAAGNTAFEIVGANTSAIKWGMLANTAEMSLRRGENALFTLTSDSASTCGINIYGGGPGNGPVILPQGVDANIDLTLLGKGSGLVRFGIHAATVDSLITGFIVIKDSLGNQRKLAIID
jgi:hypothetical protein